MWETSGEIIAAVGERVMPMGTTPKVHPVGVHVFNLRPKLASVVANQNKSVAPKRAQIHVAEIPSPTTGRHSPHNLCATHYAHAATHCVRPKKKSSSQNVGTET